MNIHESNKEVTDSLKYFYEYFFGAVNRNGQRNQSKRVLPFGENNENLMKFMVEFNDVDACLKEPVIPKTQIKLSKGKDFKDVYEFYSKDKYYLVEIYRSFDTKYGLGFYPYKVKVISDSPVYGVKYLYDMFEIKLSQKIINHSMGNQLQKRPKYFRTGELN